MMDMITDVTALSSKGQIVLPKMIRDSLALMPGSRLMVFSDGENILLKPIKQPDISEFNMLMDEANAWARNARMTEDDILKVIKVVRKDKKGYKEAMKVTYIYHSCFLVETDVCYYLFDYYKGKLPELNPQKPVLVCCSHKHEDHYQPSIFAVLQEKGMEHILAVLSRDITKKGLSVHVPYIEIRAGNTYELPYGQILTAYHSTDKGVAFLIQEGDTLIYHSGDLNDWVWEEESDSYNRQMTGSYRKEIDMLAEKMHGRKLDAAFLVLDPRQAKYYDRGLLYFLKKINCDNIYPMHYWEKSEIIDYFLQEHPEYRNRITKIE